MCLIVLNAFQKEFLQLHLRCESFVNCNSSFKINMKFSGQSLVMSYELPKPLMPNWIFSHYISQDN